MRSELFAHLGPYLGHCRLVLAWHVDLALKKSNFSPTKVEADLLTYSPVWEALAMGQILCFKCPRADPELWKPSLSITLSFKTSARA